ncbi:hypothetical protein LOTGIDRAFT_169937 [Lottia gigantea]|uniref:Uncharacterized protein n=1 Tax=Lottia gigantea TaxID=225164 RepID=V3ZEH1_LOTGI|nr:hypothetical protein LOTGIDRAFT_169937 [Lottia gigantea]ESO82467.1 hypothetical protein LOTGIDRAFT_169937 [Lottia gigantea]
MDSSNSNQMLPKAEIVQFLTIALVWLAPMVIARSIDITEKILEENTENMEALALTNLARQKPVSPYMPSQLTDLFNNAFAKHTMMRIKGLRKVFDHVRGKKSHPPNHHERRVIVGGICCNGKR